MGVDTRRAKSEGCRMWRDKPSTARWHDLGDLLYLLEALATVVGADRHIFADFGRLTINDVNLAEVRARLTAPEVRDAE